MPIGGVGIGTTDGVGWGIYDGVGLEGDSQLESLILDLLRKTQSVTTNVSTRIYLGQFPDMVTYPSILFTRILGQPINYLSNRSNGQRATIQMDAFSTSYMTAFEVSTAIKVTMKGADRFSASQLTNQDLSQPIGDMKMLYRISQDYSCWYKT